MPPILQTSLPGKDLPPRDLFSFSDKTTNKCEQASHLMNLVVAALLILSHTLPHLGQFNLDPPVIERRKKLDKYVFKQNSRKNVIGSTLQ